MLEAAWGSFSAALTGRDGGEAVDCTRLRPGGGVRGTDDGALGGRADSDRDGGTQRGLSNRQRRVERHTPRERGPASGRRLPFGVQLYTWGGIGSLRAWEGGAARVCRSGLMIEGRAANEEADRPTRDRDPRLRGGGGGRRKGGSGRISNQQRLETTPGPARPKLEMFEAMTRTEVVRLGTGV